MGHGVVSLLDGFLESHNRQITGSSRFHRRVDRPQCPPIQDTTDHWQMLFDESLNIDGAGVEIFFVSPNKYKLRCVLRIHFFASKNVAKYEACLHGIRLAVDLGVKRLYVHDDSALVIN